MADYTATKAPFIDVTFYVTSIFGNTGTRSHKGIDIATVASLGNVPLYSMCTGKVIYKNYDADGFGYYVIMKETSTNYGILYAHMNEASLLSVGDAVVPGTLVGYEGSTGNSSGIHCHVEMEDLGDSETWDFSGTYEDRLNPADYMGFPNTKGISVYYDGTTPTPTPTPAPSSGIRKSKFPWVLYSRKLRNINKFKR